MAFKLPENVQETESGATGTGDITLLGAVSGFFAFSSQLSNGDTTFYVMSDGTDLECGIGTYTNTSGQQLSRDTVIYSTNGNAKVNWASGTRNVFSGLPGAVIMSLLNPGMAAGLLVKTADRTYTSRQIDVDTSDLQVANEDGVSGNPTLALAFTVSTFIKTLLDDTTQSGARNTLGIFSSEYDNLNSGSSKTIDWTNGAAQKLNMDANCTISFTDPASAMNLQLKVTNTGGGIYTFTWPGNVYWANGDPFDFTQLASSTGFVALFFDGTDYWAQFIKSFS